MQALTFLLHPTKLVKRILWNRYQSVRPVWVEFGHGGIDPNFRRAMNTCVQVEMDRNLSIIEDLEKPHHLFDRIMNCLVLCTQVRTKRLIRFTQYHADELNKSSKGELKEIYKHVHQIESLRHSALNQNTTPKPSVNPALESKGAANTALTDLTQAA